MSNNCNISTIALPDSQGDVSERSIVVTGSDEETREPQGRCEYKDGCPCDDGWSADYSAGAERKYIRNAMAMQCNAHHSLIVGHGSERLLVFTVGA